MTDVDNMTLAELADECARIDQLLRTNPQPPVAPPVPPERERASKAYPSIFSAWARSMLEARDEWARQYGLIATDMPEGQIDCRWGMAELLEITRGWGNPFGLLAVKKGRRVNVDPVEAEREASAAEFVDCFRRMDETRSARPFAVVAHGRRLDDFEAIAHEHGLVVESTRSWWHPHGADALVATREGLVGGELEPRSFPTNARARA